jgi:hypothetical protein
MHLLFFVCFSVDGKRNVIFFNWTGTFCCGLGLQFYLNTVLRLMLHPENNFMNPWANPAHVVKIYAPKLFWLEKKFKNFL